MWSGGRELESWAGAGPRSLGVSPAPHHRLRRLIPCSLPIGTSSPRKDSESRPQPAVWAPTPHLFLLGKPCRATGFPTLAKTSKPQVRSPHRLQGAAGTRGPSYQGRGSRRCRGLRGPHALASSRDQRKAVFLPPKPGPNPHWGESTAQMVPVHLPRQVVSEAMGAQEWLIVWDPRCPLIGVSEPPVRPPPGLC